MGELILCSGKLAANPYYLEDAAIHVYSLEELSYYIESNAYLLGPEFMTEELCLWIGKELGLKELSDDLKEQCRNRGSLSGFAASILNESSYLNDQSKRQVLKVLREMENKSEFECGKIRADRYMMAHRYIAAIYEYRRVLNVEERNPILVGDVWHNLGCAYAGLFLFSEAEECFEHAYMRNENPESLKECIFSCMCMSNEGMIRRVAEKYQVTGELLRDIRAEWNDKYKDRTAEKADISMITDWKNEYRRNCRL